MKLSPNYPQIKCPTYLVSQANNAFRTRTGEHLQRDIAGLVLTFVPDTGHYIQFDQPNAVIDAIRQASLASTRGDSG